MCLLGVSSKNFTPTRTSPHFPRSENCALQKPFFAQKSMNLGGSAGKIRIRIENSPWNFKFWVKHSTGSRIIVVSVHAQQKIGYKYMKSWSNLQDSPPYSKMGHTEFKFRVKFYTGSSLMAVSAHAH